MRHHCSIFAVLLLLAVGCRRTSPPPGEAGCIPLEGYRFHLPCGEPVLSGNAPGGAYFAYVLMDSLQVADCIDKEMPPVTGDPLPLRNRNEFLLVLEAPPNNFFRLQNLEITDSMLHIHLQPDAAGSAARIWKINGSGVKLIRLMADPLHYAYVPGPAWDGSPADLRRAHWKEEQKNTAGN